MPALRPRRTDKKSGRYLGLYALHIVALVLTIIGYYCFTATDTTKDALQNAIVTTDFGVQSNHSSTREDTNATWSSPPSITLTDTFKNVINSVAGPSDAKGGCKAKDLGYQSVNCPYWDASAADPLSSSEPVDYRVRYLWRRQHPIDCGNANFMAQSALSGLGFGAVMRGHFLGHFIGAVRSNRVFIQDVSHFPYSGCNDSSYTCYFEPITNCSYENHVLPLLEAHSNETEGWTDWKNTSHKVVKKSRWAGPGNYPAYQSLDDLFVPHGTSDLEAGALLYLLRLNAKTKTEVEDWLHQTIPCDLDPSRTISLPIRASDKCIGEYHTDSGLPGETSCPEFSTYMEICEIIRENDPAVDTIILTSEDARFVEQRHAYTQARGARKPWRFILNSMDVMQGGGTTRVLNNNTMHDVFMSFFTTMHMQLRGKYFILNCSSNFHALLKYFAIEGGCAFVQRPIIICMDEQASRFKICTNFGKGKYAKCMEQKMSEDGQNKNQKRSEAIGKEEEDKKKELGIKKNDTADSTAATGEREAKSSNSTNAGGPSRTETIAHAQNEKEMPEAVKRRLKLDLRQAIESWS